MNLADNTVKISIILLSAILLGACGSTGTDDKNDDSVHFNSGTIAPGETYSYTFNKEGSWDYYCEIHSPDMQGKITVSSATESAETDTVAMENNQFQPSSKSVAPGTKVVWINRDSEDHTVVSGSPSSSGGGY